MRRKPRQSCPQVYRTGRSDAISFCAVHVHVTACAVHTADIASSTARTRASGASRPRVWQRSNANGVLSRSDRCVASATTSATARFRSGPIPSVPAIAYDRDGNRTIPWGVRPASNPRYPLGPLIAKRFRGLVDLFICDEIHEAKSLGSAIGAAFGAMVNAAHRTVGLTGTLFSGYASDVYGLLLRLHNTPVMQEYGWDDEARFVAENGVVDEVTRQSTATTEGHYSGKTTTTTTPVQRPGVTARLTSTLQGCSINILLPHMGFHLVDYQEKLEVLADAG